MIILPISLMIGVFVGFLSQPKKGAQFPEFRSLYMLYAIGISSVLVHFLPHNWSHYIFWFYQIVLFFALLLNFHLVPIRFFTIGYITNGIAIISGSGEMPVFQTPKDLLQQDVKQGTFDTHNPFHWLGDWIPFHFPHFHVVTSPGDLLMGFSIIWIVRNIVWFFRTQHIEKHGKGEPM